jgi:hypothetical protein
VYDTKRRVENGRNIKMRVELAEKEIKVKN